MVSTQPSGVVCNFVISEENLIDFLGGFTGRFCIFDDSEVPLVEFCSLGLSWFGHAGVGSHIVKEDILRQLRTPRSCFASGDRKFGRLNENFSGERFQILQWHKCEKVFTCDPFILIQF